MPYYFGRGITAESPGNAFTAAYDAAQLKQKQSKLAELLANAYGTQDDAQRQQYMQEAIRTDPKEGMTLAKLLDPRMQSGPSADTIQSTFVDAGGNRVGILRSGQTVQLGRNAPNNQIIDTGNGFYGVNKGNLQAAPVMVGGQAPQPGQWAQPGASYQTPSGVVRIDPSIDPADLPAIQADIANSGQADSYALPPQPQAPGQQLRAAPDKPAFQSRQFSPQEVQQMGLPTGTVAYTSEDGTPKIVSKPEAAAGGGAKPIPVGALRPILEAQDALGATQVISDIVSKHAKRLVENKIPFGPIAAAKAKARTFADSATPEDVNFNEWEADKTKIVNESLRLNKGVQTEGDAQRAVKELMGANDRATAARALKRLAELNNRAVQLQQQKMRTIYRNYGRDANGEPLGQPQQPAASGGWKIEVVN